MKTAPLLNWECHHPNRECHYRSHESYHGQVPTETTVWLRSDTALWELGICIPYVDLHSLGLVEEVKENEYSGNNPTPDISLKNQHRDEADWVFRLKSAPPPQYTLKDVVKAVAPSICSVIIARLWIALGGCDITTAVTFVSFIFMANVGVLMLLGISWICER